MFRRRSRLGRTLPFAGGPTQIARSLLRALAPATMLTKFCEGQSRPTFRSSRLSPKLQ
jgi:hypothetical protein